MKFEEALLARIEYLEKRLVKDGLSFSKRIEKLESNLISSDCVENNLLALGKRIERLEKSDFDQNTQISLGPSDLCSMQNTLETKLEDHETDCMYLKKRIDEIEKILSKHLLKIIKLENVDYNDRLTDLENRLQVPKDENEKMESDIFLCESCKGTGKTLLNVNAPYGVFQWPSEKDCADCKTKE